MVAPESEGPEDPELVPEVASAVTGAAATGAAPEPRGMAPLLFAGADGAPGGVPPEAALAALVSLVALETVLETALACGGTPPAVGPPAEPIAEPLTPLAPLTPLMPLAPFVACAELAEPLVPLAPLAPFVACAELAKPLVPLAPLAPFAVSERMLAARASRMRT